MKKVIIFDFDGVLADSIDASFEYFRAQYPEGVLTREIFDEFSADIFLDGYKKFAERNMRHEETEDMIKTRKALYTKLKSECPLFAGIPELLKELDNKGYILAINTSAKEDNCAPLLEKEGIRDLFEFIGSSDVSRSKVEKFALIQETYGVQKEDMLFVTDSLGDVIEADTAGVPTIAVTWGVHDISFFKRKSFGVLKDIVDSVGELKEGVYKYFN